MTHRAIRRTSLRAAVFGLAALACAAPDLSAQALAFEMSGCSSLLPIHDVDGDGVDDLAAGLGITSRVHLASGVDGHTLRAIRRPGRFGAALASPGDVDGDGVPELLVGAPDATFGGHPRGAVHLLSLGTGTTLWVARGPGINDHLGAALAVLPDLNGDGQAEIAAGAPQFPLLNGENGRVIILDGATGVRLGGLAPEGLSPLFEAGQFGAALCIPGDLDGDGLDDLAVGMPGFFLDPGRVTLHSSATLLASPAAPLRTLGLGIPGFGRSLAAPGDLDGDDVGDLLVGSPSGIEAGGGSQAGGALLYSGGDGSLIMSMTSSVPAVGLGESVAAPGDLDLDGVPDLLVAGRGHFFVADSQVLLAVSGADGSLLFERAEPFAIASEVLVAATGDLTGDGRADFAYGLCGVEASPLQILSHVALWSEVGDGVSGAGGVPSLSGAGDPTGADPLQLQLAGGAVDVSGMFMAGASFGGTPFHGGVLVPVPEIVSTHVHTDALGAWQASFTWPAHALGEEVFMQVWLNDPTAPRGLSASNGLRAAGT